MGRLRMLFLTNCLACSGRAPPAYFDTTSTTFLMVSTISFLIFANVRTALGEIRALEEVPETLREIIKSRKTVI